MADKPVDEVVQVDAVLDGLSSPSSSDVYEALLPFSNDAVAAVAAKRAAAGGGGGGSSTPGALIVGTQDVGFADIALNADSGGKFTGPPYLVTAGMLLVGFGYVISEAFDDSGLSGADTSIIAVGGGSFAAFGYVALDLTNAATAWDAAGVGTPQGFYGRGETPAMRYRGTAPGGGGAVLTVPDQVSSTDSHREGLPVLFATDGNICLCPSAWNGDAAAGLISLYYYLATPVAA